MSQASQIKTGQVVFRTDLYPRIHTDPATVQKYAEDLSVLPPIEVNQHGELIDGWHRWTAHKKKEEPTISAFITETSSDYELLELAIERNSAHGLQLSQEDKRDMARKIYHASPEREREAKKKHLAKILSVSERTVREWLSRIDKDTKEARDKRIFDLWLACRTQEEIAERESCSVQVIKDVTDFSEGMPKNLQPSAQHHIDFDPPLYNVWKQQEKTPGVSHFGNSEVRWLDNLLYLYTKPLDIVIDPFAGSGSTIDICKKRLRRYWVGDRKPVVEREQEIREHDITSGLPDLKGRWGDVGLVYLDPPYWKQAENKYSDAKSDLGNMTLDEFTQSLSNLVMAFAKKKVGHIALMLQPTQWNAPERAFTDHVADMLRLVKLSVAMRISCPYESQQCNAQMVEWAKQNKQVLVLTREIIVWRCQ